MKEELQKIVTEIKEKGMFKEGVVKFKWNYEETPGIEYQLIIQDTGQTSLPFTAS